MGSLDRHVTTFDLHESSETPMNLRSLHTDCPGHAELKQNFLNIYTGWRSKQPSQVAGVSVRRCEGFRCWRHYTGGYEAEASTPAIAWRREAWKGRQPTICSERTKRGHRQAGQHWNCFKGNIGERCERQGGAHMGFPKRVDTILK